MFEVNEITLLLYLNLIFFYSIALEIVFRNVFNIRYTN